MGLTLTESGILLRLWSTRFAARSFGAWSAEDSAGAPSGFYLASGGATESPPPRRPESSPADRVPIPTLGRESRP